MSKVSGVLRMGAGIAEMEMVRAPVWGQSLPKGCQRVGGGDPDTTELLGFRDG